MPTTTEELQQFHQYATSRISHDSTEFRLDELFDDWLFSKSNPAQPDGDLAAVREAIVQMELGDRGRPAADIVREVRESLPKGQ